MKHIKICIFLFLLFSSGKSSGQEFYEDGCMILKEVSQYEGYGYLANAKSSIKVGKIENEYAFLRALRSPSGGPVTFRRFGSCCEFKCKRAPFGKGFLDKFEIRYDGLIKPIILYLNAYEFEDPRCPVAFTFVTEEKVMRTTQ
jgi:hypothetical protein